MRILYLCDEYPPGMNGGIGTAVQVLAREMVQQGHQVFVIGLYSYYYGQEDHENDQGVEVYRLRYGLKMLKNVKSRFKYLQNKLPSFLQKKLYGQKDYNNYISSIKTLINKEKIDIIEAPDYNTFDSFLGFIPEIPDLKVPLHVKIHGSKSYTAEELKEAPNPKNFTTDQLLYQRANSISAVSNYAGNKIQQQFLISKPIKVLYNSIPIVLVSKNDETRNEESVVFVGSLLKQKGVESLMLAWNLIHQQCPSAELILLGKGKTKHLIEMLTDEAKKTVKFKGQQSRDVVYHYLEKGTLAIFPSYTETFGLCAIEAMSVGCPTIFTKLSCGSEIVRDQQDGLLVDPDNIAEIATTISKLIEDKSLQKKYAINGRKAVEERFNIVKSAEDHITYYQQTIKEFQKIES